MRFPNFIKDKDTICFVALSFGASTEPYLTRTKAAKNKFLKLGYNVIETKSTKEAVLPYLANTPSVIAKEFMDAYLDKNTSLLISVGGGEMQCLTLPYLDFEALKKAPPKWVTGFSDNTNYSFLFPTILDVATIYGACASSFGMRHWHASIEDEYALLKGTKTTVCGYPKYELRPTAYQKKHPLGGYNLRWDKVITTFNYEKPFSGRLLGGCLDVLITLCGTKYDYVKEFNTRYQNDGVIWCLEACDLSPVAFYRALFQLREAGWFATCRGFIIGRGLNTHQKEMFGIDEFTPLELLKDFNVPILANADLGHLKPSMPLVFGSYATVSYDGNIQIEMTFKEV